MSGRLGADPESLRRLASAFERAGEGLEDDARQIGTKIRASGWDGPDARRYLNAWDSQHKPVLIRVGRDLASTATTLRREAKEQERASGEGGSGGPGGPPGGGGGSYWDEVGAVGAKGASVGLAGYKAWKTGSALTAAVRAGQLGQYTDEAAGVYRAAGGLVGNTARSLDMADDLGILGRLGTGIGTAGRIAGGVGGVFGVVGGFNQMFNTQYDGARGVTDRVMGGVSVVGGAGGIAMALGGAAMLGPVGVGVVVGAGVVAGAWALGNLVYDNWDSISAFAGDAWDVIDKVTIDPVEMAQGAVKVAGKVADVAGDVADSVGDTLGKAGDFVGGLFG
ncbi:hypothetical protein AAG589_06310 [Isoptericola sp. F-RaC21]|uniref:hypothetical protein n=1 Tax=Isoptericola sp. F-RaC21 TaxID=3141452 RepID=UPI00315BAF2D